MCNDLYVIYQLDEYQFLKLGYTMIDYDYTGTSLAYRRASKD